MIDLRYNNDNFIPPIEDGEDMFKYRTLVKSLLNLEKEFEPEDFEFMRSDNRTRRFGYANSQVHYFFFCIDWKDFYFVNPTIDKLTLYDIFRKATLFDTLSETKKKQLHRKKVYELQKGYLSLKALFQGDLECRLPYKNKSLNIQGVYELIIGKITRGIGVSELSGKYLNEFIGYVFEQMFNVDYETQDVSIEGLPERKLRVGRLLINTFEKLPLVYAFTKTYRRLYGANLCTFSLSDHAIPHILMRHVVPFKIYERKAKSTSKVIKNYLGKYVGVSAIVNEYGHISVIGDDGVLYFPVFTTNQNDYIQFISSNQKITQQIIEQGVAKLFDILHEIAKILEKKGDYTKSPNIVYFQGMLYGIEINEYQGNTIDSFYPLNSEYQEKNGVLKKDFDKIINKEDMPENKSFA